MNKVENNIIIGIDTSCYTTSIAAISLGKKVILKLAEAVDEEIEVQVKNKKTKMGGEKKIEARILDYQKGIGLTVLKLNTEKEYTIPLENITSAQLNDDEQEK